MRCWVAVRAPFQFVAPIVVTSSSTGPFGSTATRWRPRRPQPRTSEGSTWVVATMTPMCVRLTADSQASDNGRVASGAPPMPRWPDVSRYPCPAHSLIAPLSTCAV